MIIDTETTGLPDCRGLPFLEMPDYKDSHKYEKARPVQISFILCDSNMTKILLKDYIVKIEHEIIDNWEIHGINNTVSSSEGMLMSDIAKDMSVYMDKVTTIISHNLGFHISCLKAELYRTNQVYLIDEIEKKEMFCALKDTKEIISSKRYMSFYDFYKFCTGDVLKSTYNSKYDVINLHHCLTKLVDKKLLVL